jgi:MFS transporter, ACS family, hexuronate transporter
MKIRRLRWYIAALLFTSTVINYIDRQTLSIVAPLLTKELGLSPVQYSNILTAFLAAYTLMYLGSGLIVDRWGTRISLSVFMTWWSVSNMLHGLAQSAMHLGVFRVLLGAGESGNFMAAVKVVSEWYPAKERAFVNGLVNAGAAVGAIIATPLVTYIALMHGWRTAFVVTGSFGFVWLAAWLVLFHVPEKHPRITDEELALVQSDAPAARVASIRWVDLLKYRQTWGLLLSRFLSDPVWWFYLFWLPKYLVENRGFTMVEMGMLAWLPYLTADIGSVFGGLLSGYLVKRKWEVLRARSAGMLPFALMMPASIAVAYTSSRTTALALICLVTFAHMAWKTNLVTVTNDIYPRAVVGSVAGIVAFGNGVGGTLFTYLTGHIVERFSYDAVFLMMGVMHPIAYVVFRLLVKGDVTVQRQAL